MKKLISLCLSLFLTMVAVSPGYAAIGMPIGNIYTTDILATINGVPIPSYSLNGKTAIVVEDLRHYGFEVIYNNENRMLNVHPPFGGITANGLPAVRGQVGAIAGNIFNTDIVTDFVGYVSVPSFAIEGRMCVAIEDLSDLVPYMSHQWDGVNRIINLIVRTDELGPGPAFPPQVITPPSTLPAIPPAQPSGQSFTLLPGEHVVGSAIPAGRYTVTSQNNGILGLYEEFTSIGSATFNNDPREHGVESFTFDFRDNQRISLDMMDYAVFTPVMERRFSNTLTTGSWVVGLDIAPGTYTAVTASHYDRGWLTVYENGDRIVNGPIIGAEPRPPVGRGSWEGEERIPLTLRNGQVIHINSLSAVIFNPN